MIIEDNHSAVVWNRRTVMLISHLPKAVLSEISESVKLVLAL
jgi:hypothetical protein